MSANKNLLFIRFSHVRNKSRKSFSQLKNNSMLWIVSWFKICSASKLIQLNPNNSVSQNELRQELVSCQSEIPINEKRIQQLESEKQKYIHGYRKTKKKLKLAEKRFKGLKCEFDSNCSINLFPVSWHEIRLLQQLKSLSVETTYTKPSI